MNSESLIPLLGARLHSPEFVAAVRGLNEKPDRSDHDGGRTYINLRRLGLSFVFKDEVLSAIQLLTGDADELAEDFKGQLPSGLAFSDSMAKVVSRLGQPAEQSKEVIRSGSMLFGPWVKYRRTDHSLHVQFAQDGSRTTQISLQKP